MANQTFCRIPKATELAEVVGVIGLYLYDGKLPGNLTDHLNVVRETIASFADYFPSKKRIPREKRKHLSRSQIKTSIDKNKVALVNKVSAAIAASLGDDFYNQALPLVILSSIFKSKSQVKKLRQYNKATTTKEDKRNPYLTTALRIHDEIRKIPWRKCLSTFSFRRTIYLKGYLGKIVQLQRNPTSITDQDRYDWQVVYGNKDYRKTLEKLAKKLATPLAISEVNKQMQFPVSTPESPETEAKVTAMSSGEISLALATTTPLTGTLTHEELPDESLAVAAVSTGLSAEASSQLEAEQTTYSTTVATEQQPPFGIIEPASCEQRTEQSSQEQTHGLNIILKYYEAAQIKLKEYKDSSSNPHKELLDVLMRLAFTLIGLQKNVISGNAAYQEINKDFNKLLLEVSPSDLNIKLRLRLIKPLNSLNLSDVISIGQDTIFGLFNIVIGGKTEERIAIYDRANLDALNTVLTWLEINYACQQRTEQQSAPSEDEKPVTAAQQTVTFSEGLQPYKPTSLSAPVEDEKPVTTTQPTVTFSGGLQPYKPTSLSAPVEDEKPATATQSTVTFSEGLQPYKPTSLTHPKTPSKQRGIPPYESPSHRNCTTTTLFATNRTTAGQPTLSSPCPSR